MKIIATAFLVFELIHYTAQNHIPIFWFYKFLTTGLFCLHYPVFMDKAISRSYQDVYLMILFLLITHCCRGLTPKKWTDQEDIFILSLKVSGLS